MRIVVVLGGFLARCRTLRRHVPVACYSKRARGDSASRTARRHRRAQAASMVHRGGRAGRRPRHGAGGSSNDWGFVQPDVARFTRVCSYDRAGMGYSDAGPSPRTARRIASELAELLARSGIGGPVVLVGASIAGFDVRVFASDHPERAAGLGSWMPPTKTRPMRCRGWRGSFPCCRRSARFDCSAYRSARESNRWLRQCTSSHGPRVFAQLDTRRRLTKSSIFGRAHRKSGARAASSRSLCSSSPADEEPTSIGDSCNEIKPRCQNEDA